MYSENRIIKTIDEAGAIAVNMTLELEAKEQAMFVAGFQECYKYMKYAKENQAIQTIDEMIEESRRDTDTMVLLELKSRLLLTQK